MIVPRETYLLRQIDEGFQEIYSSGRQTQEQWLEHGQQRAIRGVEVGEDAGRVCSREAHHETGENCD